MDTPETEALEVPDFKLAKVGKDRRRRLGGGWFAGRGASSGLRVLGGGGAVSGAGASGAKLLILCAVAGAGSASAWQWSQILREEARGAVAPAARPFAEKSAPRTYDDLSGVVRGERTIPNSLGYLAGSVDGLTPEERAKQAADAEAARRAEEEARAKEDARVEQQAAAAKTAALDPAALLAGAAQAGRDAQAPSGKFGRLSSGFGGGSSLSGGAGLSGGVSRTFASPNLGQPAKGSAGAFAKASKPAYVRTARAPSAAGRAGGLARRQLLNAGALSRKASGAGQAESSVETAGLAFNGGTEAGSIISGSGVGKGRASAPDAPTPLNEGGPIGAPAAPQCSSAQHLDSSGKCVATAAPKTQNAAKYQKDIDLVKNLLMLVAMLAALALALKFLGVWAKFAEMLVKYAISSLGALIAAIGVKIATMGGGDFMIGGIVGAVGGYIAFACWTGKEIELQSPKVVIDAAAQALIVSALGGFATAMAKKPAAV